MCVFFRSALRVPVALPCTGRCSLDINPKETHALAAQLGGRAHLVNISQEDQKGKVEQVYSSSDPELQGANWDFGARFANGGSTLFLLTKVQHLAPGMTKPSPMVRRSSSLHLCLE